MRLRGSVAPLAVVLLLLAGCSGSPTPTGSGSESPGDASTPGTASNGTPEAITPAGAQASATAPDSTDAAGNPVSYGVANVLDGDPATAWRLAGDGLGMEIVLDLGGTFHVTSVGLIPGYAKVDPTGDIDRFAENRRITSVRWDFADGSSVTQTFTESPTLQWLDVDVTTTWVRLRIMGTTEDGGRDFTAISDVAVMGTSAGS
jgi:hypothetical protein